MKLIPMLFKGDMVRAIIDGHKTQTRRVMKVQPPFEDAQLALCLSTTGKKAEIGKYRWVKVKERSIVDSLDIYFPCPYGSVGDRIWVRETFGVEVRRYGGGSGEFTVYKASKPNAVYCTTAAGKSLPVKWTPSIHMPRELSRIQLEITGLRIARLQDISEEDAKAEGVMPLDGEHFERPMERSKDGWKLCPKCAGTGLHSEIGAGGGVTFDVDCRECDTHVKLFKHLWNSTGGDWDANPYVWVIEFKLVPKHNHE